jgi:hypothetical protein
MKYFVLTNFEIVMFMIFLGLFKENRIVTCLKFALR